jgi:hypothetical protein
MIHRATAGTERFLAELTAPACRRAVVVLGVLRPSLARRVAGWRVALESIGPAGVASWRIAACVRRGRRTAAPARRHQGNRRGHEPTAQSGHGPCTRALGVPSATPRFLTLDVCHSEPKRIRVGRCGAFGYFRRRPCGMSRSCARTRRRNRGRRREPGRVCGTRPRMTHTLRGRAGQPRGRASSPWSRVSRARPSTGASREPSAGTRPSRCRPSPACARSGRRTPLPSSDNRTRRRRGRLRPRAPASSPFDPPRSARRTQWRRLTPRSPSRPCSEELLFDSCRPPSQGSRYHRGAAGSPSFDSEAFWPIHEQPVTVPVNGLGYGR